MIQLIITGIILFKTNYNEINEYADQIEYYHVYINHKHHHRVFLYETIIYCDKKSCPSLSSSKQVLIVFDI
jgi:hypothetical protein